MNLAARLKDIQRICEMRQRLAHRRMQVAVNLERQRTNLAEDGRAKQRAAKREAEDYISERFAAADLSTGAATFIESLALGHRHVERRAVACAISAKRLCERHRHAVEVKGRAAQELLLAEQRLSQRSELVEDVLDQIRLHEDETEEEEIQEIQMGREWYDHS
ncbi:hypothetical protein [uncultured Roseobacter sp.]|uniref:hypothetical protein n=1 Tax=uncultured Roseobacter sp. TaxID=114847 RepID=UPI002604553B|nr:hypothetical protein [uncultured Roseobacter sp.]